MKYRRLDWACKLHRKIDDRKMIKDIMCNRCGGEEPTKCKYAVQAIITIQILEKKSDEKRRRFTRDGD
jgi:hypothetical protein